MAPFTFMSNQMDSNKNNQDPYEHRLGTGMVVFAWLIFLGLLVLLFDNFLDKQRNPNENVVSVNENDYREVILQRNRAGHYIASGRINGVSVEFLLDTGATHISIPAHIAKRISLRRGPAMRVMTANGDIEVYSTELDLVELGDIRIRDVRAGINPYMRDDGVLLGMSFLKQLDMVQKDNTLTLRQYR